MKPNREPFVGGGTRVSRGNTAKYYELESKFERLLMEWSTKHEVKLGDYIIQSLETYKSEDTQAELLEAERKTVSEVEIYCGAH